MRFLLYLMPAAWATAGTFAITPASIPHGPDQRILGAAQLDGGSPARPDAVLWEPGDLSTGVPGTLQVQWDYRPHEPETEAETTIGRVPNWIAYQIVNADEDPLPDIVFIHSDRNEIIRGGPQGYVSILFNRGRRQFEWKRVSNLPFVPNHLAVADFDRDGKPDIQVGGAAGRGSFLPGQGGGAFPSPDATSNIPDKTTAVGFRDLNGDGFPELVYVGTAGITVITGGQNRIATPYNPTNVYLRVAFADVNQDGRPDVVVLARDGPYAMLNLAAGIRAPAKIASMSRPSELAVADMDGDGREDLLVADGAADRSGLNDSFVQVMTSLGNGTFAPAAIFNGGPSFVVFDADRDGLADIVSTTDSRQPPFGQFMRGTKAATRVTAALVGTPPTAYQVSVAGERPSFGGLGGSVKVTISIDGRERPAVDLALGANGTARPDFDFGRARVEVRVEYPGNANYLASVGTASGDFTPAPPPPVAVTVSSAFGGAAGDVAPDSRIVIAGTGLAAEAASAEELQPVLGGLRGNIRDSGGNEFALTFDEVGESGASAYLPAGVALGAGVVRLANAPLNRTFEGPVSVKAVAPALAAAGGFAIGSAVVTKPDGSSETVALTGPDGATALDLQPGGSVRFTITGTGLRGGSAFEVTVGTTPATEVAVAAGERPGVDSLSFVVPDALAAGGETGIRVAVDGVVANEVKALFRRE